MFGLISFGSLIGVLCNIGVSRQQVPEPHTGYRRYAMLFANLFLRGFDFCHFELKSLQTMLTDLQRVFIQK